MQHPVFQRSALAIGVMAASFAAHGQDADSRKTVQPIDVITIIGRQSDASDVPGSAHVIDAESLEVFNDTDILRVLRAVPGVYLQEEEGFGLRPNIGIRGSGLDRSARIALLEDGVLIAPAPYSAPSAYYFPTQRRMSSLEVLKGPASVVVGPRTTGGALNMISTPIPEDFGANVDLRVGEHNSLDVHAHVGNGGKRFSWLLETVQGQSDGFMDVASPIDGDTGFDIEDYVAKMRIESDPSADVYQSLGLKVGYTDQVSDQTYLGVTDADFATDPLTRYAATEGDIFKSEHEQYQVDYVVDPGDNWRVLATAYRNDFQRNWYKLQSVNGVGLNSVLTDPETYAAELSWLKGTTSPDDAITKRANNRSYYSQGIQAEIQWDFGFGETEVALNAGLRLHEDEEDRFQHQNDYRMEDGLLVLTTAGAGGSQTNRVSDASGKAYFVNAEIRSGRWILTPGVRFEDVELRRLDYSTADPGREQGPSRVRRNSVSTTIPGIGALYRINSDWRLLAGVHKGYNPPGPGSSAEEESSLNIETGVRYDSGALRFEGIYFLNDYDNLVGTVTESTGGGGEIGDQYDGGEVKVAGFELSGGYEWTVGDVSLPLSVEYTWTTEAEFKSAFESGFDPWGDVQVGDELPYIPEHQLRASTGLESDRWRFNVSANYMGQLRTVAGQGAFDPAESIDSRVVWDVLANWRFTDRMSAYLKVDNLLDETYVASRRPAGVRPGLPRTAYLGFVYSL
jgi:Fe(3+) dicitrate transport protein